MLHASLFLSLLLIACGDETHDTAAADTGSATDGGDGGADTDTGEPPPPEPDVAEFGFDAERELEVVLDGDDGLDTPRDLKFHPERDELWVLNRYGLDLGSQYSYLDGASVTVLEDPAADRDAETYADFHAYHFMDESSSIAFGAALYSGSSEVNFATCQESVNDYGGSTNGDDFMGMTLWSSDLDVFAAVNQSWAIGGSHLDMLHQTPLCVGTAWEGENVYWAFDGDAGDLVRYDFAEDHDAGGTYHEDGLVRRYSEIDLVRVPDVSGHLVIDHDGGWIYAADTGNGRVVRMDIYGGEAVGDLAPWGERLAEYTEWEGATIEVVVEDLSAPSGLYLDGARLFISDFGTGEIIAFDLDAGVELGRMETDADGIMGVTIGPEGYLWYVDAHAETLTRVLPAGE